MSSREGPPTITEKTLAEHEKFGRVEELGNTSERWKGFSREASVPLLKSRESSTVEVDKDEEVWQELEPGTLLEGSDQESSWQKKKIVFERENGTQKIEERVTAESTDHEYFSSQDRDTQGKVKKESELILILEDGQRIRLNNLLPPEFSLRPYLNEEAHPVNQRHLDRFGKLPIPLKEYQGNDKQSQESDGKILGSSKKIIYGDLRRKGGLFWLLHEVGHAWDQHDDPTNNELESNLYQLLQRLKEQQPEGHHAPSVDDSQVQLNQDCYDTESQPLVVKKDVLVRIVQEGIDSERGATVFALNLASILEKEGIDIDPGMSGDEIYESIESALAGYQHDVLETYYHTPEDLEKMKDHSFV